MEKTEKSRGPGFCPHFITADTACECGCMSFRWTGPASAECTACLTEYDVSKAPQS